MQVGSRARLFEPKIYGQTGRRVDGRDDTITDKIEIRRFEL